MENEMEELLKEYKIGSIIKIINDKGYGFIDVIGEKNIFFHASKCMSPFKDLRKGDIVQFKVIQNNKGTIAKDVTVVKNN